MHLPETPPRPVCDCAGCASCPVEPAGLPSWLLADDAVGPDACAMCGEHIGQWPGLLCRACSPAGPRASTRGVTGPEGMATCIRIALGTPEDAQRLDAGAWREAARELRERCPGGGSRESVAATACDAAARAAERGEDLVVGVPAYAGRTYREAAPLRAAWLARVAVREALGPWGAS